jgi:hypothetical protein
MAIADRRDLPRCKTWRSPAGDARGAQAGGVAQWPGEEPADEAHLKALLALPFRRHGLLAGQAT